VNISVTVAKRKKNSAGVAPAVFRSVTTASKRINGGSAMAPPGFVLIANESGWCDFSKHAGCETLDYNIL